MSAYIADTMMQLATYDTTSSPAEARELADPIRVTAYYLWRPLAEAYDRRALEGPR